MKQRWRGDELVNVTPREFRALWPEFKAESWSAWGSIEDAVFGLEPADLELVERVTGRKTLPSSQVAEVWVIAGRGAGKSRWCARTAVFFGAGRHYQTVPGERIYVGVFGADKKQATITFRYVLGLLRAVPALDRMISRELRESVELDNGVTVEVIAANKAAPRGRSYALAIVEEAAFLPADDSANPDTELLRALRPALARVPGSLLAVVSSPYARRGELWRTHRAHFGKDGSESVLVVQAPTLSLNPSFDTREIERAYREDPVSAAAEYGAQFRSDVESFVALEAVEACVVPGRRELPPIPDTRYFGFLDFAGGSGQDSATLAISHSEKRDDGQKIAILDCLRETRPPFSPRQVCAYFATELKRYSIKKAIGDRYAGDFPVEHMREFGVTLEPSKKVKSVLYKEILAQLNSGTLELLDNGRLVAQVVGLERRTARGGRDSIDHAPGGHDDLVNAAAGALLLAAFQPRKGRLTWGDPRPGEPLTKRQAEREMLQARFEFGWLVERSQEAREREMLPVAGFVGKGSD